MTEILPDTNLLLLAIVGDVGERWIATHRRLRAYDVDDHHRLRAALDSASRVVLCPHVLTETSNLLRYASDGVDRLSTSMRSYVERHGERPASSLHAVRRPEFSRLGLTDAALLDLASSGPELWTADVQLCLAAAAAGYRAVNFLHPPPS